MKKIFSRLFWLFIPALLLVSSSCLDITEEYFIRKDGSGKATLKIDMSQMLTLLESFGGMDSTGESMKEMDDMFQDNASIDKLKEIPGIFNVQNISDKGTGIVGFSYEFKNLEALNSSLGAGDLSKLTSGMGMGGGEEAAETEAGPNLMTLKGKKFTRQHPADKMEKPKESEDDSMGMAAAMMAEGEYKIIYHFEQKVKKTSMPNAVIGEDGKTVEVKNNMAALIKGEAKFGGNISLK
jgi:hypothetical protein